MFTETRRALTKLEYAAARIAKAAGTPTLFGDAERQWYRFTAQDNLQVIAVKGVRVVSALNATFRLLEFGFSVESAVVLRTVDDFVDEITLLLEGLQSGTPTRAQQEFRQHFFDESIASPEALLDDRRGPDRVKKKEIQAAQARYLDSKNPDKPRRMVGAIDRIFDGYVHGSYPSSMELFDPNRDGGTFRMSGTEGTPYPAAVRTHFAHYVSRALSVFGMIALQLGNETFKDELMTARDRFEASGEFPSVK